ncbi:hypothetical protein BB561_005077 [Smittium simulii]|uniref:Methylmalonic aciduria and homocystinuria type D protein n=1 Tax=Smittium simulii TaxID=133385 RepID=A0A2T9YCE5_9FUNG|nr:hypothetical protein BB561_005077 [Smittium simulii]
MSIAAKKYTNLIAGPCYSTFAVERTQDSKLPTFIDKDLLATSKAYNVEYTIHSCPKSFKREIKVVFHSLKNNSLDDLYIIPIFQKTKYPMVEWSEEIKIEKDVLLLKFYNWGQTFVSKLNKLGYWADIVCPASGVPVFSSNNSTIYSEVEGCRSLLKYSTFNVGSCSVISHPLWDMNNYPATAFAIAPPEIIIGVIDDMKIDE